MEMKGIQASQRLDTKLKHTAFRHPIVQSFLQHPHHHNLMIAYYQNPNPKTQWHLDQAFKRHFIEIRVTAYIVTIIERYAQEMDERMNRRKRWNVLVYDQPLNGGGSIGELSACDHSSTYANWNPESCLDKEIEHPGLEKGLQSLSERQYEILMLSVVQRLTEKEIAEQLKITQQSVSKTKKRALAKLKAVIEEG